MSSPEQDKQHENGGSDDVLEQAREFVDSLPGLHEPRDILEEAEQIAAQKEFQEWSLTITEDFSEFLEEADERVKNTALVFAMPLVEELEEIDSEFGEKFDKASGEDQERVNAVKREKRLAYNSVGVKAVEMGVAMLKAGHKLDKSEPAWHLKTQSPYEISSVFMKIVGERLGDKHKSLPIGWQLMINGLFSSDVPIEEQIESAEKFLDSFDKD